jgi:hypothetical protein
MFEIPLVHRPRPVGANFADASKNSLLFEPSFWYCELVPRGWQKMVNRQAVSTPIRDRQAIASCYSFSRRRRSSSHVAARHESFQITI